MKIELTEDEALVLFDLLFGFATKDEGRRLDLRHVAERNALWALEARIEKQLVAPFGPDYTEMLQRARLRVEEQGGPW